VYFAQGCKGRAARTYKWQDLRDLYLDEDPQRPRVAFQLRDGRVRFMPATVKEPAAAYELMRDEYARFSSRI
jgi:hypothetical protein